MSKLLQFDLEQRRSLVSTEFAPLVHALRRELLPMFDGALPIPEMKAKLTRIGGRCSFDGTLLDFDPWSPHEHRCRQCHRVFIDRAHDEWWAMGAQLWIAERAAQAAALHVLEGDEDSRALSLRILTELADRYESWPNKDNALGPTRPFFSTYLESIWLINICHAIELLEQSGLQDSANRALGVVRDKLVAPSCALIATFHEGRSNRQVWNEVAILSALRVLQKPIDMRLSRKDGLFSHYEHGLLDDGAWYEGENYHLFAHRGLWYGTQFLHAVDRSLPARLESRYSAGFVTPFLGVLPDDTIPSRRDSQYKVSIRQWRFAEWCELGIAHAVANGAYPDERLVGTLHRLYHADPSLRLEKQSRHPFSTADAERNEPAGLLSRADLSWRGLLTATPALHEGSSWSPGSVCLPRQGLAVIRRESGRFYAALEGGHTGGGHGHPDRLALTLQHDHARWLEDPGTGSYVEKKLHWYRSTLAHAAPVIDGASQDAVPAKLLAFDDRGAAGWISKRVENVKPGVNITRSVVVGEGYLIDVFEWDADRDVRIDLPIARSLDSHVAGEWKKSDPGGAGGLEDGFDFLTDVMVNSHERDLDTRSASQTRRNVSFTHAGDVQTNANYSSHLPLELWRADAPGSPGQERGPLHWIRMRGARGMLAGVWTWNGAQQSHVEFSENKLESITIEGDTTAIHTQTDIGWHIALKARHATSSIDLTYLQSAPEATSDDEMSAPAEPSERIVHAINSRHPSTQFELGENHYRRTEQIWDEAGAPTATVSIEIRAGVMVLGVFALTGDIVTLPLHAENQLDNECADVNSDGVEVFVGSGPDSPWSASWLAVPNSDSRIGDDAMLARVTGTTPGSPKIETAWGAIVVDDKPGYAMRLVIPLPAIALAADGTFIMQVIVNERSADRQRRRGQLVLGGSSGFSYLRGDRADPREALTFSLPK